MAELKNNFLTSFAAKLRAAREMEGITMQELADRSELSKQAISKFEAGQLAPSSDAIIKISNALKLNQDFFFVQESADGNIRLASIALREKQKLVKSEFESVKADTIDYLIRSIELEKLADNIQEFKNPVADIVVKTRGDVQKAAKQLRRKWSLGNVPISNVVNLLESKGIKVFEVCRSENFEGLSAWAGTIPVIVINSGIKELTRVRFTALHELGHIVLQFDDVDEITIERLCDAFSGELLFPQEAIIVEFGAARTKISIEELKQMKLKYGMSVSAILSALFKAGVIDFDKFKDWKQVYRLRYVENKDFGCYDGNEKPQRFDRLLMNCLTEELISFGKASSLAKMKEGELKKKHHLLESQNVN